MAYVDASAPTRVNVLGIATAIGVNALFLVGISSISPSVVAMMADDTEVTIDHTTTAPPKVTPRKSPPKLVNQPASVTPLVNNFTPVLQPVNFTVDPILTPLTPPIPPIVTPILPPQPVITSARYDMRFSAALQPEYPIALARAEVEGVAVVNVRIGNDGRVIDVVSIRSDDPGFFEATRAHALRKWRFRPAMRDGVATESWRQMTVKFQMPNRFE